jgi:hypothetical protein
MSEKRKWISKVYDDVGCPGVLVSTYLKLYLLWHRSVRSVSSARSDHPRPIRVWVESADPSEEQSPTRPTCLPACPPANSPRSSGQ